MIEQSTGHVQGKNMVLTTFSIVFLLEVSGFTRWRNGVFWYQNDDNHLLYACYAKEDDRNKGKKQRSWRPFFLGCCLSIHNSLYYYFALLVYYISKRFKACEESFWRAFVWVVVFGLLISRGVVASWYSHLFFCDRCQRLRQNTLMHSEKTNF